MCAIHYHMCHSCYLPTLFRLILYYLQYCQTNHKDLAQYISDDSLERKAISNYSEDVDFAMWVHSRNQILRLYILNNKNVFWIHNAKSNEKMDQRYNDYFVKQRKFPKYSFWLKPKWWGR